MNRYHYQMQTANKSQSLRRMLLEASPANTGNIPIHIAQQVFKQWSISNRMIDIETLITLIEEP